MFKKIYCRWQNAYRVKAANRRNYQELNALSDHTLKDIGLCRSELLALSYAESFSKGSNDEELLSHNECCETSPSLQAIGECNV